MVTDDRLLLLLIEERSRHILAWARNEDNARDGPTLLALLSLSVIFPALDSCY